MVENRGLQIYAANVEGVQNVLKMVRVTASLRRVLFTSTKLVNKNGEIGKMATDFAPDTLYGQSKVLGEQIVRRNPPAVNGPFCALPQSGTRGLMSPTGSSSVLWSGEGISI